jgi:hypothetical protein
MECEYELFERRTDGVLTWRGTVQDLDRARLQVKLIALETDNECFALQVPGRQVVAHAETTRNVPAAA